jgi:hypothetical protein
MAKMQNAYVMLLERPEWNRPFQRSIKDNIAIVETGNEGLYRG